MTAMWLKSNSSRAMDQLMTPVRLKYVLVECDLGENGKIEDTIAIQDLEMQNHVS